MYKQNDDELVLNEKLIKIIEKVVKFKSIYTVYVTFQMPIILILKEIVHVYDY